ncbi:MAG TPA: cupin domain-containing protein [Bryobacteraceae bacterium]|nr:cupin domain-containing protein [Bryobacteraceae bacterium]
MKIIGDGCRVFDADEGEVTRLGTWTARARICHATGAEKVTQTVNEYAPGKSPAVLNPVAEEVLYVVSGTGSCQIDGLAHDLRPGTGVYIPPGSEYVVENTSSQPMKIVSACCPEDPGRMVREEAARTASSASRQLTVNEADRKTLPATAGREFRLLVDKDLGCEQVTQFVGWIPPSTAPFHHHTYEEGVFILDGHGIVHAGEESCEFGPGTSIYLPVGVTHCLENPGTSPVRVLGVFFPSGSPAAAYQK